jgi:hypothetical protein
MGFVLPESDGPAEAPNRTRVSVGGDLPGGDRMGDRVPRSPARLDPARSVHRRSESVPVRANRRCRPSTRLNCTGERVSQPGMGRRRPASAARSSDLTLPNGRRVPRSAAGAQGILRQLHRGHGRHVAVDPGSPTTRDDRRSPRRGTATCPRPRSRTRSRRCASHALQDTVKCCPAQRSPMRFAAGKAPISVLPHEYQEEALHRGQPAGAPDRCLVCVRVRVEEP